MNHSDRVIVMAEGRVIAEGEPHEVRADQKVIDAYLGGAPRRRRERETAATAACRARAAMVAGYMPEVDILNGVSIQRHRGRDRDGRRAQRRRQVDPDQDDLRPAHAAQRVESRCAARTSPGRKPHDITRLGLSYVPQVDNVFPTLTVEENLEMGALDARAPSEQQIERMYELFPRLGERTSQARGHDVRRRAADGGDGAGADARPAGPAARRAVGRPRARLRRGDLREDRGDQQGRRDDRDGRAERAAGARDVDARLRARPRQGPLRGPGKELLDDPKVAELYLGGRRASTSRAGAEEERIGPASAADEGPRNDEAAGA